MRRLICSLCILWLSAKGALAQLPKLTIYDQNFAVVRVELPLDLKQGINHVSFSGVTNLLEPDSVILSEPAGQYPFRVLEQNYRAGCASLESMLQAYEGKQINFLVTENGHSEIVPGKIIRSGNVNPRQPIIEVNGQLRFSLPGVPLFPALAAGSILKPVLSWVIASQKAGHVNAQLSYITSGLDWDATYNVIEPGRGATIALVGWVTIRNRSGMTFNDAQVSLMAGKVNKIPRQRFAMAGRVIGGLIGNAGLEPLVTEQPFDEYHLFTLQRPISFRNQETKQVEFIDANGINVNRYFVYDGAEIPSNLYYGWNMAAIRQNRDFGTKYSRQVRVYRSFANTQGDHLGVALPAGKLRFYREGQDGTLEFLGEGPIARTPVGGDVRVYTGNAFDLEGERLRTNYVIDNFRHTLDESFKIRLSNHKKVPVEIRVVEHLYRGDTWEIIQQSDPFVKMDSHTIEFRVEVAADGQKTITYTVHYTW